MALEFLYDFFQKPILEYSGYNPVNTLVYMAILLAVAFGLVFPFFKKRGVLFDFEFFKAVFPYILFGSSLRVFEETYSAVHVFSRSANPLEFGFYMVSPGIYIMIGLLTIFSLALSIALGKKAGRSPLSVFGLIGWVLAVPIVFYHLLHLTRPFLFFGIIGMLLLIIGLVYALFRAFRFPLLKDRMNLAALAAQASDGVATFFALSFLPMMEQHFVSRALIETFSPLSFVFVKVALVLAIVYFVDREVKETELKNFIKLFVIIIGFAPGIRDAFSIGLTLLG